MKLNLGCGGDIRPGYVNIDKYVSIPGTTCLDAEALPFPHGSIEEIVAQDVLEHITHRRVEDVLKHWVALLAPGGTITIRTPDARKQAELLLNGVWPAQIFSHMVYGAQDQPGNYHRSCFTMETLVSTLQGFGMVVLKKLFAHGHPTGDIRTSDNPNLVVVARKP